MPSHTILIADDNQKLLQMLAMFLRKAGYEVITALDGYQALQFAIERKPDLVILDINMPAGDGFSVQQRINKAGGLATPVIYLTGEKSDRVKSGARELGAAALIHKPFEMDQLLGTIESILANIKSKAA